MGIFSRLTDIIDSNINALLERAEDPEKMISLIIQEMEDTLVEVRSTAARAIADRKGIERNLERIVTAQEEWQRKAEFALSKARDDLAKGALLERKKLCETADALQGELVYIAETLAHGEADVIKLETKLTEAKAKQKTIRARHETVGARLRVRRQLHDDRIEETFARFEAMEKRLDETEGEVESYDLGQRQTLAGEIAELEAAGVIEEELAALKARVRKSSDEKS